LRRFDAVQRLLRKNRPEGTLRKGEAPERRCGEAPGGFFVEEDL
jgi:hypothetical protein